MSTENNNSQFSRIERMIGSDGLETLAGSRVVIVGLGAVGGYAMEALCRSGTGMLRLVDFDLIQQPDINRQILALHSTEGKSKVLAGAARIRDINPACKVETLELFAHTESFDTVLAGQVNVVIDAIDAMTPKAALIDECAKRNIPLISAMGAAMRTDPTAIRIARLAQTSGCPLARQIRRKLKRMGSMANPLCVYSSEPAGELSEKTVASDDESNEDIFSRGRKRRTLGSLPTLTGIFGLSAAQAAMDILLGRRKY